MYAPHMIPPEPSRDRSENPVAVLSSPMLFSTAPYWAYCSGPFPLEPSD